MNRKSRTTVRTSMMFLIVSISVAVADGFEINWYTIDGGADMLCTGDDFELSGTIGQPDAGMMTGGDFELLGGFVPGTTRPILDNHIVRARFTDYGTSGDRFPHESAVPADVAWVAVASATQIYSWEGNLRYDDGTGAANHLLADADDFTVTEPLHRQAGSVASASQNDEFRVAATHSLDEATLTTQLEIANISGSDLTDVDFAWMLDADLVPPDGDPAQPCCPAFPWLGFGTGQWDGVEGRGMQYNLNTCAGIVPANVVARHTARMDDTNVPQQWTVSNPVGFQGATCAFDGQAEAEPRYLFELPFDNTQGLVGDDQDLGIVTSFRVDLWPHGTTHTFTYTLTFETGGFPGDLNCDGTVNAFDIDPFVLALTDPAGYAAAWSDCDIMLADINGDGVINAFDIDPFVELLTGG